MADIFLSYKKEDLERLRPIISGLESEGFTVWWDYAIETGEDWWASIVREIKLARALVGCWTANSVQENKSFASNYVDEEHVLGAAKLAPALFDAGRIPVAYKNIEAADLSDWTGSYDHPEWRNLVARIETLATPKWVRRRYAELDQIRSLEIRRREAAEAQHDAMQNQIAQLTAENARLRLAAPAVRDTNSTDANTAPEGDTEVRVPAAARRNAIWMAGAWLVAERTTVRKGTPIIELRTATSDEVATVRAPADGQIIQKAVNSHAMAASGSLLAIFRAQ